jgi:hypothetical protein
MSREDTINAIAREFHNTYHRITFNEASKAESANLHSWHKLSEAHRERLRATVRSMITDEMIEPGPNAT